MNTLSCAGPYFAVLNGKRKKETAFFILPIMSFAIKLLSQNDVTSDFIYPHKFSCSVFVSFGYGVMDRPPQTSVNICGMNVRYDVARWQVFSQFLFVLLPKAKEKIYF